MEEEFKLGKKRASFFIKAALFINESPKKTRLIRLFSIIKRHLERKDLSFALKRQIWRDFLTMLLQLDISIWPKKLIQHFKSNYFLSGYKLLVLLNKKLASEGGLIKFLTNKDYQNFQDFLVTLGEQND